MKYTCIYVFHIKLIPRNKKRFYVDVEELDAFFVDVWVCFNQQKVT